VKIFPYRPPEGYKRSTIGMLKKNRGGELQGAKLTKKMKISPPVTPSPLFLFQNSDHTSFRYQLFSFIHKFDFGNNKGFFRFLGFFKKNLNPKKCVLGVKNEKNEKSKYAFWFKMKSLRKESVLIF
jgi:hypothetical protein